jgi:membrane protein
MEFAADSCPQMAAGIAYFIFFSIFPILLIGISIAGFRLDSPEALVNISQSLQQFLPPEQADFLIRNIEAITAARAETGIVGLVGLIWAGRGMFLAMEASLNEAWGNPPTRSFMGRNLVAILLIFLIGLALIASVMLSSIIGFLTTLEIPVLDFSLSELEFIGVLNRWIVSTFLIFLVFSVIYKILPHNKVTFRNIIPGAIFSTIVFKLAEFGYIWYISNMANLASVYGSIGSLIGILLWLYIGSIILLFGAEFNISYLRFRNKS